MDIFTDITPFSQAEEIVESEENGQISEAFRGRNQLPEIKINQLRVMRTLGEGAFGEVKLLIDKNDSEIAVAVKLINLDKHSSEQQAVRREALLHRFCSSSNHPNVLKYLGVRLNYNRCFLQFMEYADGGELFDQIEPDVGMPAEKARFYFHQLLDGLEHIHLKGVVHRDIKPENLLLNSADVLKISDFGMATIFRHNDVERLLDTPCGSRPYVAPELLNRQKHRAEPIDVWSCGVVLITLLVGELPWESPENGCEQFRCWACNEAILHHRPWKQMDTLALSLLSGILQLDPSQRMTIGRIRKHPWMANALHKRGNFSYDGMPPPKMPRLLDDENSFPTTQPDSMFSLDNHYATVHEQMSGESIAQQKNANYLMGNSSFSQPADCIDSLLLSTQHQTGNSQLADCSIQKLVRRMTRFCLKIQRKEAVELIEAAFNRNGFITKHLVEGQIVATSLRSSKKPKLVIVATTYEMAESRECGGVRVLADFRRSRGDGLEFKRVFLTIGHNLREQICSDSYSWMAQHGLFQLSLLKQLKINNGDSPPAAGLLEMKKSITYTTKKVFPIFGADEME